MFPKNDSYSPFVSSLPPIDVFSETKGTQGGNEIVSSLETSPLERRRLPKMETRIFQPVETSCPEKSPVRFHCDIKESQRPFLVQPAPGHSSGQSSLRP
jgi:hypothetical protein